MPSAVPQRPLLAPWYRVVGDGERLLLEHAQRVVVLEGAAVRKLLPRLLPLLDGTRTVDDLVARIGGQARDAVELALETLAAHGLVTEGPDAPLEARGSAHAAAAAYGLPPAAAAERLREAVLGVVGSGSLALEVARLAHAEGIGRVRRLGWRGSARPDLVVVAPAVEESEAVMAWNRHALDSGVRWLPVLPFDGRWAPVGPLVVPGESCCYECVRLRRAANLEYGADLPDVESAPVAVRAGAALELLAAAVATHLAVRWLIGRDTTVAGVVYAIEVAPRPALSEHAVLRVPRCPACSPAERQAAPLPWHAAAGA